MTINSKMLSAKLIKNLEKYGYELDFPTLDEGEMIEEIIASKNERLYPAIPLLLSEDIRFSKLRKNKKLMEIISYAKWIFKKEGLPYEYLPGKAKKSDYYYERFKETKEKKERDRDKQLDKQIELRSKLKRNEALKEIFAPAKIRIMDKIFNHEKLTDTELKYYYRAIRPLIYAINNEELRDYLKIIETTKKQR